MQKKEPSLLCSYRYDALDRLVSHASPQTHERQRFYFKNRLASEVHGAVKYCIVQQGDLLLAQQRVESEVFGVALLATDQQRSVLHMLQANNKPHGIAYSPYGNRPAECGLTSLLGFNGERPDDVTGDYLLGIGYRAFNQVLLRFNSPDSMSPFGKGGLNTYAYCKGDPVNYTDPTGHFTSQPRTLRSNSLRRTRQSPEAMQDAPPRQLTPDIPSRSTEPGSIRRVENARPLVPLRLWGNAMTRTETEHVAPHIRELRQMHLEGLSPAELRIPRAWVTRSPDSPVDSPPPSPQAGRRNRSDLPAEADTIRMGIE